MNTTHESFLNQKRFASLDGLRAISILGVIWHHTAAAGLGAPWHDVGAQGVSLFFAISGFLITTLLLRELGRTGAMDLQAFYMRRALRIFPLYFGVLFLYAVMVWLLERNSAAGQEFWRNLPYFLTYTSNLFVHLHGGADQRVIFYFAWSLATEEQFYLCWPLALIFLGRRNLAMAVLAAVWTLTAADQWIPPVHLGAISLPLLGGAVAALLLHRPDSYRVLAWVFARPGADLAAMGLTFLAAATPECPTAISGVLFVATVVACVIQERHALSGILRWRIVVHVGAISYGMYMLHMLCKNAAGRLLSALHVSSDGYGLFGATTLLALLAASLSFRYFEQPFLRLKHRFER